MLYTEGRGDSELDEVFRQANGASTWTFALEGMDSERTKLVVRWRARWDLVDSPISLLIGVLLDPIEFIMECKMMHGITERAEAAAQETETEWTL